MSHPSNYTSDRTPREQREPEGLVDFLVDYLAATESADDHQDDWPGTYRREYDLPSRSTSTQR